MITPLSQERYGVGKVSWPVPEKQRKCALQPHHTLSGTGSRSHQVRWTQGREACGYPAKLPELEYPEGAHLRRVSHQGSVRLHGVRMFVSALLAWEVVGLLEVETHPDWLEVYYGPLVIGWMDRRKLRFSPTSKPIPRE